MAISSYLRMENQRRSAAAAVKEGGRILATTFLSLLLPLSFLLLARLSVARYFLSAAMDDHEISFLTYVFLRSKTTLILSFLVSFVAMEALVRSLSGNKPTLVVRGRRRLCLAWFLIFLMQVCLSLGIHGTVDTEIAIFSVGNLVSLRRVVFALGLHEMTVFWRRSAVAPVVGSSRESFGWMGEVALAAALGNLWCRRLRDEAEGLVVLPWVLAELDMADALGWLLYYLTAAMGGVRVIKGFLWASRRCWPEKKGVDAAANISVIIH